MEDKLINEVGDMALQSKEGHKGQLSLVSSVVELLGEIPYKGRNEEVIVQLNLAENNELRPQS